MSHDVAQARTNGLARILELVLFNIRWALIPFYLGLVAVLLYYGIAYFHELWVFLHATATNIDGVKIFALDTIDIVMVANLIKMIITGSYNSFVSKGHGYINENISSGELKIKIATSVVVLSMIHLLKSFISTELSWFLVQKQLIIFGAFVVTALILAIIEYIHSKC